MRGTDITRSNTSKGSKRLHLLGGVSKFSTYVQGKNLNCVPGSKSDWQLGTMCNAEVMNQQSVQSVAKQRRNRLKTVWSNNIMKLISLSNFEYLKPPG